jgi:soluble lytic murein transglycosylase-like protein
MTDPNLFRWSLRFLLKRPFITIFILTLLDPAPLIGDSAQAQALKDHHLSKIRSALDLQEVQMSDEALVRLTRGIANESEKHSLDPLLVLAIIEVESRFDQKAVSSQGALGLMQLQPL